MTKLKPELTLYTDRLLLQVLGPDYAPAVLDYWQRNRSFHEPWFPRRDADVFTLAEQAHNLEVDLAEFAALRRVVLWISEQDQPTRVIGRFSFCPIQYGALRSTVVGYHLDAAETGKGYATEAGQAAFQSMFKDYGLHRIEAFILPYNRPSLRLAERLGMELEGLSPRYLQINGVWQDHLRYIRLADGPVYQVPLPDPNWHMAADSERMLLRVLTPDDRKAALAFCQRNRDELTAYNPIPESWFSTLGWAREIALRISEQTLGKSLLLGIFLPDRPDWMAGFIALEDLRAEPAASAEISFAIDRHLTASGRMLRLLTEFLPEAAARLQLRRIIARVAVDHDRSRKTLALAGFKEEGIERRGLVWPDGRISDTIRLAWLALDPTR